MRSANSLALLAISAATVLAQNFSESYAPIHVECPSDVTFTRSASEGLNPEEEQWFYNRKRVIAAVLPEYLSNANMKDFDIDGYISAINKSDYAALPAIGVAVSGGGFASAIMGTGVMRALDGREELSNAAGTGGLLQSLSFYSGQSGGSWAVMTITTADYPSTDELLDYWQPQIDRFHATTNSTHAVTLESIAQDIAMKARAGFNVSAADMLGRVNSYEFIMGPNGGLNATMSSIKQLPKFQSYEMPFPIVQVTEAVDGDPVELTLQLPTLKSPMVCVPTLVNRCFFPRQSRG